jgi:hypothetical protein
MQAQHLKLASPIACATLVARKLITLFKKEQGQLALFITFTIPVLLANMALTTLARVTSAGISAGWSDDY